MRMYVITYVCVFVCIHLFACTFVHINISNLKKKRSVLILQIDFNIFLFFFCSFYSFLISSDAFDFAEAFAFKFFNNCGS